MPLNGNVLERTGRVDRFQSSGTVSYQTDVGKLLDANGNKEETGRGRHRFETVECGGRYAQFIMSIAVVFMFYQQLPCLMFYQFHVSLQRFRVTYLVYGPKLGRLKVECW